MQKNKIYESVQDFCGENTTGWKEENDVFFVKCEVGCFYVKLLFFESQDSCIMESKIKMPEKTQDELDVLADKISDMDENLFCTSYDGIMSIRTGFSVKNGESSEIMKYMKIFRELDMSLENITAIPIDEGGFVFGNYDPVHLSVDDIQKNDTLTTQETPDPDLGEMETVPSTEDEDKSENTMIKLNITEVTGSRENNEEFPSNTLYDEDMDFAEDEPMESTQENKESSLEIEELKDIGEEIQNNNLKTEKVLSEIIDDRTESSENDEHLEKRITLDQSFTDIQKPITPGKHDMDTGFDEADGSFQSLLHDLGIANEMDALNALYDRRDVELKIKSLHLQERTETVRQMKDLLDRKLLEAESQASDIIREATENAKEILNDGYKKAQVRLIEKREDLKKIISKERADAEVEIWKQKASLRNEKEQFDEMMRKSRQELESRKVTMHKELSLKSNDLAKEKEAFLAQKMEVEQAQKTNAGILEMKSRSLIAKEERLNQLESDLEYRISELDEREKSLMEKEKHYNIQNLQDLLDQKEIQINTLKSASEKMQSDYLQEKGQLQEKTSALEKEVAQYQNAQWESNRHIRLLQSKVDELNGALASKDTENQHLRKIVSEKENNWEELTEHYLSEFYEIRIPLEDYGDGLLSCEKDEFQVRINIRTGMMCVERFVENSDLYKESLDKVDENNMERIYSAKGDSLLCYSVVNVSSAAENCMNIMSSLQGMEPDVPEQEIQL